MGLSELTSDRIAAALFGSARQAVLGLLFDRPDERFYQRQIVRALMIGTGAVQRELARLVAAGILLRAVEGHQTYYQVNRNSPIYPELHGLVRKTMGLAGAIRTALEPLAEHIRLAFIYGSLARGGETAASDIDLMIVGDDVKLSQISPALVSARASLQRELNPTAFRTEEFSTKLRDGNAFLTRVVEGQKVFLIGSQDELDRLAQRRTGVTRPTRQGGAG
jgi:predicted nucleotidyltransferase